MDAAIFREETMGLRARLLMLPLAERFHFDAAQDTLFILLSSVAPSGSAGNIDLARV
jgi:hypothetical protein